MTGIPWVCLQDEVARYVYAASQGRGAVLVALIGAFLAACAGMIVLAHWLGAWEPLPPRSDHEHDMPAPMGDVYRLRRSIPKARINL